MSDFITSSHDKSRKLKHSILPFVVLIFGFLVTGLLFWWSREIAKNDLMESFQYYAKERFGIIQHELNLNLNHIEALQLHFTQIEKVRRGEFNRFVQPWMDLKSIQALEWIPSVPFEKRTRYETEARKDGLKDFRITERNNQGQLLSAGNRAEYYPVFFVEPLKGNEVALGYDLASNPMRLAALEKARDTGQFTVTERISLVQEGGKQFGFLVFAPVYEQYKNVSNRELRRENLRGFVLGVFRAGDLLETAINKTTSQGLDSDLRDITAPSEKQLLFELQSGMSQDKDLSNRSFNLVYSWDFPMADKTWRITVRANKIFIREHYGQAHWFILPIGILVSLFISFYLYSHVRQRETLEASLKVRTKELRESEEAAQKLARENLIMARLSRIIGSTLEIDEVYEAFAQEVKQLIPFDGLAINLINNQESVLVPYVFGPEIAGCQKGETFPLKGSITGEVVRSRSGILIRAEDRIPLETRLPNLVKGFGQGLRSVIVIPLISRDSVIGSMHFRFLSSNIYSSVELELAERVGQQVAGAIANAMLFEERRQIEEALRKSEQKSRMIAVNVTEEKEKIQTQFLQAQKMESVGRLAGGVAHDINNMLGIIIGNAQLASMNIETDSPISSYLREILKAGGVAADTVRQLMAFARKQIINPKSLDLNETIAGMVKMLRRLIGEDIELKWIPEDDVWKVYLDPTQINQILANLVVNSRDAIKGPGIISLETSNTFLDPDYCSEHEGCVSGEYVAIVVSDDGSGMTKEIVEQVFEPFFTTKEIGKGTGLGMSTVYGIVKQNKGYITIESQSGRGTKVKLYFPKLADQSLLKEDETEDRGIPTGSEAVLLVEDQEQLLNVTKGILTQLGYSVLAAGSPKQAIQLAEGYDGEIHLLLTDVIMPGMNGIELSEHLLRHRKSMKVLYMSGYTAETINQHTILDGKSNLIEKPFLSNKLAEKIREVLDR